MPVRTYRSVVLAAFVALASVPGEAEPAPGEPSWEWAGWGGGGFYYAAEFHPTRNGVIYLGGDVAGMYKSVDHGQTWRLINDGIADYGVFSLAADPTAPDTVYAATPAGLCKSTDGGARWSLLPDTGPGSLGITGVKGRSTRCIAVDPADGRTVYAGTPGGTICRSRDGGETWRTVRAHAGEIEPPGTVRIRFGKVNNEWYGGFWSPLEWPEDLPTETCAGVGFAFKGDGTLPREAYLTLKAGTGAAYRSRNLREAFGNTEWHEVRLTAADFVLDPDYARQNPEKAEAYTGTPDWAAVERMDFACVGPLMNEAPVGTFGRVFASAAPEGQDPAPTLRTLRELGAENAVHAYGNVRVGPAQSGPVYAVRVAAGNPSLVLAASDTDGILVSRDGGDTWQQTDTPKRASSVAPAPSDPAVVYATFFAEGLRKSTDGGATWQDVGGVFPEKCSLHEVAVSPANPDHVFVIGSVGWNGAFFSSTDGGDTWTDSSQIAPDPAANPTLPQDYRGTTRLSAPKNIAVNPLDPRELFIAANWRPCHSADGGTTWTEHVRGADISCIFDLRFHNGRTYASAMDEGVLVSDDHGGTWRALWPLRWDVELSGHYWRLAVSGPEGGERIVSTCSPWDSKGPNRVVYSEDGGKTFARTDAGLPETVPAANTMWGTGYPRAMAADPTDPDVLYLGIDGDPSPGKSGGGVFRSQDGGRTWKALPGQPGSNRMFFGLAVDPTDSRRLYWGACGTGGGLYRSSDRGESWTRVFEAEQWVFNVHVAANGTVYCPGKNLWRSTDRGETWTKLTDFPDGPRVIVALESDPRNPDRLWFAATTWGGGPEGGVYETVDGGASWQEITGDLAYRKPLVLRYNPETRDLWAAGVALHKTRR